MAAPALPGPFEFREADGVGWIEAQLGETRVVFSLRNPPGSSDPADQLDLGRTTGRPGERALEARRRLCDAIRVDAATVRIVQQVHGTKVLDLREDDSREAGSLVDAGEPRVEADGFIVPTLPTGPPVAIVTADCLPVVLESPDSIALLHLGWRGIAGGLAESVAAEMDAGRALIGPGVGACCYEVGPEVPEALGLASDGEGTSVDLVSIATRRLLEAGVREVVATGLCTSCEKEILFSHRRNGEAAGRQATIAIPAG